MSKILISLVTHSDYADVCENFIELFNKNWRYDKNKFDFIVNVIGNQKQFSDFETYFHGKEKTLPGALYDIVYEKDYEYCISFLGDAFINSKVNDEIVLNIIDSMKKSQIDYCCLIPRIPWMGMGKRINSYMRAVSNRDSYNISFVAFIASRKFILDEFNNNISDLNFEEKYLKKALSKYEVYKNKSILYGNYLGLVPGIDSGKWNRHALKKLTKKNPEISFTHREKLSAKNQLRNDICHILQIFLTRKQIIIIKKILRKLFKINFFTKN